MDQINSINYIKYPKSTNHKITWTKKNNIKTCDLNPNCMELIFDIKKNKNVKIFNDSQQIFDKLPVGNLSTYETFSNDYNYNYNYNIIQLILVIILIIILYFKKI